MFSQVLVRGCAQITPASKTSNLNQWDLYVCWQHHSEFRVFSNLSQCLLFTRFFFCFVFMHVSSPCQPGYVGVFSVSSFLVNPEYVEHVPGPLRPSHFPVLPVKTKAVFTSQNSVKSTATQCCLHHTGIQPQASACYLLTSEIITLIYNHCQTKVSRQWKQNFLFKYCAPVEMGWDGNIPR